jgi:hypothetical protein
MSPHEGGLDEGGTGHSAFTRLTSEHGRNYRAVGTDPWWTVSSEDVCRSERVAATDNSGPRWA